MLDLSAHVLGMNIGDNDHTSQSLHPEQWQASVLCLGGKNLCTDAYAR